MVFTCRHFFMITRHWVLMLVKRYRGLHKVRHARRGEGVRESVTVCDRGRGVRSMWRHAYTFFYHTYMKHEIYSDVYLSVVTDVFWLKGEWTKTTPNKTFQTKTLLTKPPRQKPPRTIEREFVQGAFAWNFCTRPTKNGGSRMCDVLFWGVLVCVTKCDREEGGQNWPKIAWHTLWTAPYEQLYVFMLLDTFSSKYPASTVNWP